MQLNASAHLPHRAIAQPVGLVPKSFVIFLLAWLVDLPSQGAGAGLSTQQFFAAIYLFALAIFIVGDRDTGKVIPGLMAQMVLGALYIAITLAVGLVNDQPIYSLLRNSLTVFVYLSATYVTARVALTADPGKLRYTLGWICLAYVLANLVMVNLEVGGIDVLEVRYQIVGVSVNAALGYIVLSMIFRFTKAEWMAMLANGTIVLLSVTRSYLLVVAVQLMTMAGLVRRTLSPRTIAAGFVGLGALGGVVIFGQEQLIRWQIRLFGSGSRHTESWTLETRLSEWSYMFEQWTGSVTQFFVGSGIAAKTLYYLPSQIGGGTESMIGFGHNQHLSMLFTGGILAGLPLLVLQLRQGFDGWRFVRKAIAYPHLRNDAVFIGAWGGLTVIGCLAVNVFDPIFSFRGDAMWYGIGTGMLLGISGRFGHAQVSPNVARPPRAPAERPR